MKSTRRIKQRKLKFQLLPKRRLSWLEWGVMTIPVIVVAFMLLAYGTSWKVLLFTPFIVGVICLISVIEAMRGGIKGSHGYKNRKEGERQKPHAINRVATTLLTILICIPVGIISFIPVLVAASQEYPVAQQKQVTKTVQKKLKRYQYMVCTDLSYRYYTDEQMKSPNTGFTSESEDACKKNGQGGKLTLAENRSKADKIRQDRHTAARATYTPPVSNTTCESKDIPYEVERKPASWLNVGEEEYATFGGYSGIKKICRDTSGRVVSNEIFTPPINKTLYYGTRTSKESAESSPKREYVCPSEGYYASIGMANSTYAGDCAGGHWEYE